MKSAKQYRAQAWKSLDGNWGMMILAGILNGFSSVFPLVLYGPFAFGMASMSLDVVRGKKANIERMFAGFYNFVNTMLLGMLIIVFVWLWTLLFIIPGIVKSYAYSMSFYIMHDDPKIAPEEARRKSIELMRGYKGKLFCLNVSFIGWILLCMLTLGILSIIVVPYMKIAESAFYEDLVAERNGSAARSGDDTATGSVFPELDDNGKRGMSDEKYCDVCGTVNPSVANYCKKCGNLLPEQKLMNTQRCPVCGKDNIADAKFCKHCGTDLLRAAPSAEIRNTANGKICHVCGYENIPNAKFCRFCGADIANGAKPAEPAAPVISTAVCPVCGNSNTAGAKFCKNCGADMNKPYAEAEPEQASPSDTDEPSVTQAVERAADVKMAVGPKLCPLCGKTNVAAAKFCGKCGTDLAEVETVKDPTEKKKRGKTEKHNVNPVCSLCGKENIAGAKFCNKCGTELAAVGETPAEVCPTCGGERSSTDVYCKFCGQRLK